MTSKTAQELLATTIGDGDGFQRVGGVLSPLNDPTTRINFTYNANNDVETITYLNLDGQALATLTLAYNDDQNLTSITRS